MTSKEVSEETDKIHDVMNISNIDKKLARVSCPFTWDMKIGLASPTGEVVAVRSGLVETEIMEVIRSAAEREEILLERSEEVYRILHDKQDYFPETVLMYRLLLTLKYARSDNLPKALEQLKHAEEWLAGIKEKGTLRNVETVLDHIFIGSKCHVLKLQDRLAEADELLGGILAVRNMNNLELGMLSGCKCAAWTLYDTNDGVGISCAKKAIELDPNNGKWYFLLGQNHRESRKTLYSISQLPSTEETSAFEKAYTLSPNVFFGVSLAQLYRESRDLDMANEMYKKVLALQPTCITVRLQLALGFIRAHECKLAKECLDYIAEKNFISSRYNHYMGIYEEKCNRNFKAALPYYESTIEKFNWVAESQYLNCRRKVEPDWDPLPHMLNLLEKYEGYPHYVEQEINIRIGSYCLFELRDIPAACKHLLQAITLEPNSKRLKEHWVESIRTQVDLYQVLATEVQTILRNDAEKYDNSTLALLKDTQRLCSINCKYVPPQRALSMSGSSSSQSSRSYQNRGRGSSYYPETSGRTERHSQSSYQWRSDSSRGNENRSTNYFRDRSVRGRDASPVMSWRSRDKRDANVENAKCELVKVVPSVRS